MRARKIAIVLAAGLIGAGAYGCGDDEGGAESSAETTSESGYSLSGDLAVLDDAPPGYEEVGGVAMLEVTENGSSATVSATGLEPGVEYVSHVHVGGCDQSDPGGPHFMFDPEGSEVPPNEIHVEFEANEEGQAGGSAAVGNPVPEGEAQSIVLHLANPEKTSDDHAGGHSPSDKIACADLG